MLKIGDFGLATNEENFKDDKGTLQYMAPEYFDDSKTTYTNSVDIWAFGVIMHLLFFRELPYKGEGDSLKISVIENEYKFPEPNNLSESTKKMLKMCF